MAKLPPDPEGFNDRRAEWARDALQRFMSELRMDTAGEDLQTGLSDLLANFMHLCDRDEIDFEVCLESARAHYSDETSDEVDRG